jgi:Amt family ammonium transporter
VNGIWGLLALGLFADGSYGAGFNGVSGGVKGLFYGGGTGQLLAQAIGSFSIAAATLTVAFILMYAVKATGTLRISKAGELEGLDLHEHGMLAYPEYVIHGYSPSLHHVQQPAAETMPAAVPSPSSAS